jgi:hypothetical protein
VILDIAMACRPERWFAALEDVDAVVNCAGVLQDSQARTPKVSIPPEPALYLLHAK